MSSTAIKVKGWTVDPLESCPFRKFCMRFTEMFDQTRLKMLWNNTMWSVFWRTWLRKDNPLIWFHWFCVLIPEKIVGSLAALGVRCSSTGDFYTQSKSFFLFEIPDRINWDVVTHVRSRHGFFFFHCVQLFGVFGPSSIFVRCMDEIGEWLQWNPNKRKFWTLSGSKLLVISTLALLLWTKFLGYTLENCKKWQLVRSTDRCLMRRRWWRDLLWWRSWVTWTMGRRPYSIRCAIPRLLTKNLVA